MSACGGVSEHLDRWLTESKNLGFGDWELRGTRYVCLQSTLSRVSPDSLSTALASEVRCGRLTQPPVMVPSLAVLAVEAMSLVAPSRRTFRLSHCWRRVAGDPTPPIFHEPLWLSIPCSGPLSPLLHTRCIHPSSG